jgi:hypothetical protein
MKGALIALMLVVVALTVPVSAAAQDWVMDWHSSSSFGQDSWNLSGQSAATLTPRPDIAPTDFSHIYHPNGPVYELQFTYQGHTYGGLVAQGNYQSPFSVPAGSLDNGVRTDNSNGTFNVADGHFTNSATIGFGHSFAEWSATGTLPSVASTPEPTVLLLSAAGLVGAAVLRRSRRA